MRNRRRVSAQVKHCVDVRVGDGLQSRNEDVIVGLDDFPGRLFVWVAGRPETS